MGSVAFSARGPLRDITLCIPLKTPPETTPLLPDAMGNAVDRDVSAMRTPWSEEIEDEIDCRREDTERRLGAAEDIDFSAGRPALSSNGSGSTPCSPLCWRVGAVVAALLLAMERDWLIVLPPTTGGTASVLFLEIDGVVARWINSAGGGDVGLGGGPIFGGPGLVVVVVVGGTVVGGGGGSLGGGGNIIVGGLVRSTAFGTAFGDRVADGRRGRAASPDRDPLGDEPMIPGLCEPGALSAVAVVAAVAVAVAPATTAAPVGRAIVLTPGLVGPGMNWNCRA